MGSFRERREKCAWPTTARLGDARHRVTLTTVSETGCSLRGPGDWTLGAAVKLMLRIPPIDAQVVRVDAGGCAMQFGQRLSRGEVQGICNGTAQSGLRFSEMR